MNEMRILLMLVLAAMAQPTLAAFFSNEKSIETIQMDIATAESARRFKKLGTLYSDLGRAHYRRDQMALAAESYEKALLHHPGRALKKHIYLYMGKSYEGFNLGKSRDAYEQAVVYDRKNWRRHRDLAFISEQLGLFENAVKAYEASIKYNPKSSSIYIALGRTRRKMGLLKDAQRDLERAMDLGANSTQLTRELSLVLEGRGRFLEAAQLERAALTPSSSVSDWGRMVYLAALANDKKLANEGLVQIRNRDTSADNVSFYEELADVASRGPSSLATATLADPTLRSLVESILSSPEKP